MAELTHYKDDLFVRFEQGLLEELFKVLIKGVNMSIESQTVESPTDATTTKEQESKKAAITSGLRLKDKLTKTLAAELKFCKNEQRQLSNRFGVDIEID